MSDECLELKNIKYKTMLMNGSSIQETNSSGDLSNLERFLENEKTTNQAEPWSKLDKTIKTQKVIAYATEYVEQNELGVEEEALLVKFLKECLGKKRLYRVKDVVYDKDTGRIREIPALVFNKQARHFTLKRTDKRVSTLKSLPPKKGALKASSKSDEGGEAESSTD
jgi:hypothetical protein